MHGAAGGVGAFAVQYAKHVGAWVAATCSAANRDFVAGLGADQIIDYAREDFTTELQDLDLVLDTMGGEIHRRSLSVIRSGGRLVYISAVPLPQMAPPATIQVLRAMVRAQREAFTRIAQLVEAGAVNAQIGAILPLAEAGHGYEMSRDGKTRGKIVLKVAD